MKLRRLKHTRIGHNRPMQITFVDAALRSNLPRLEWDAGIGCVVLRTPWRPEGPQTYRVHMYSAEPRVEAQPEQGYRSTNG